MVSRFSASSVLGPDCGTGPAHVVLGRADHHQPSCCTLPAEPNEGMRNTPCASAAPRHRRWRFETQSAFEARFGVPIIETMGLTETAAQILSNPLPPGLRKIGSPGVGLWQRRANPGQADLDRGAARSLRAKSPCADPTSCAEYLTNPDATAATFRGRLAANGRSWVSMDDGRLCLCHRPA